MKKLETIELGMLVKINREGSEVEGRIVGASENFNGEIELNVEVLETREEYIRMQSEVSYID